MRVCATHRCWNHPDDKITETCPLAEWEQIGSGATAACVFVSMRLIPDNAETVERASRAVYDFVAPIGVDYIEGMYSGHVEVVLEALDGETP